MCQWAVIFPHQTWPWASAWAHCQPAPGLQARCSHTEQPAVEGVNPKLDRQRWFTFTLGASWIETSDSLLTSLIMKKEREAILWCWMMLMSFIFTPQDFFFLYHSGKLLYNSGRCQCKPLPVSCFEKWAVWRHLQGISSGQRAKFPPITMWWATRHHRGGRLAVCLEVGRGC